MAGPSRAERREQIRDELLTLIERMLDDGEAFSDISVDRLAASAGMSRTRFYLYFEDKNDLLEAWFLRIREELSSAASQWWRATRPITRRRLSGVVGQMLRAYRPHATLMAAVDEAAATDSALRSHIDEFVNADTAGLRAHIELGRQRGFVDPALDADAVARWLTIMTWRGRRHLVRSTDDAELERLAATHAALVWNVLYADAAATRRRTA